MLRWQAAFSVFAGIVLTVLMGQAVADMVSALIALGLLVCCNPMQSKS